MKLLTIFFAFAFTASLSAENVFSNDDDETLAINPNHDAASIDSVSQFENKGMGGVGMGRGGISITSRGPYRGGGYPGWVLNPLNWPIYPGQPGIVPPEAPPVEPVAPPDDPDIRAEQQKVKKLQYLLDQKKLLQQLRDLDKDTGTPGSGSPGP